MTAWIEDLRAALRGAMDRPGFALAVVLTLGIGTGAAAAVFAVVDAVLIQPLPFPESDRITGVWFASPNFPGGLERVRQSKATFLLLRDESRAFESFGLAEMTSVTIDDGTRPTRLPAAVVTAEMFDVLKISASPGRAFTPEDNQPGAEPVMILTHDLWRTAFGARQDAIGRTIRVDGVSRRIVGVLPAAVRFPGDAATVWIPLTVDPAQPNALDFVFTGYGRLGVGVTLESAAVDFDRLVGMLPAVYPTAFPKQLVDRLQLSGLFVPIREERVGASRQALLVVLLAVMIVLLVVIANAAGLFLVRNDGRHNDMATRLALGARPARLVRSLLTEGVIFGIAGAALGTVLAVGGIGLLKSIGPDSLPRLAEVGMNLRAIGALGVVAILVGLSVSLVPALRVGALDAADILRGTGRSVGGSRATVRLRSALVVGQVALALVLLVNAGLLVRSLAALQAIEPGFRPDHVLGARLYLPASDYPDFEWGRRFFTGLADQAGALPGARSAAVGTFLPLRDGRIFYPFQIEGIEQTTELPTPRQAKAVTDGWFETLGIGLLEGRTIERSDIEAVTDVVVVNRAFADLYWAAGSSALGRRIRYGGDDESPWFNVVGVVENVRDREIAADPPAIAYFPLQERHTSNERWREMSIAIAGSDGRSLVAPLRDLVGRVDPSLPLDDVRPMNEVLRAATARQRYTMLLTVVTALSALFLATIGLYGLLAHMVADRHREMGLRMALGAPAASIRGLVLRHALGLTGLGIGAGVLLSFAATRVAETVLFGVGVADPLTLTGVAALIAAVSWTAARIPAGRACAVSPATALRGD